ncbi:origin of replication binding protein [Marseillevirus Shanghai 1]|nr:origin of replication binding protein [Marseillevirus Shanghai 1]
MATTPSHSVPVSIVSSKLFSQPKTWDGKFGCPLCSFKGKDEGDLKKHYQGQSHRKAYASAMKSPEASSSFYEMQENETEQEYTKRVSLAYAIGFLPSYVFVTEKYGTLWFSHGLRKNNKNSLYSREKRGEVGLLTPQHYAHALGEASGHDIFFAYETTPFSRSFGSYPSFAIFWENYGKVPDKEKRFHEQFLEGHPAREIFDLDSSSLSKSEENSANIPHLFSRLRQEFSPNERLQFFTTEACGSEKEKYKISYHIVVSRVHSDIVAMGKFVKEFVSFLEKTKEGSFLANLIDKQIYTRNRTLRCPLSIKCEGKRRLVPMEDQTEEEPINFFATPEAHLWLNKEEFQEEEETKEKEVFRASGDHEEILADFVEQKLEGVFEIRKKGNGWLLQRERKEENFCPLCEREHEGDNYSAYAKYGRLWIYCFRAGRSLALTKAPKGAQKEMSIIKKAPNLKADFCYESPVSRPIMFAEGKKCLAVRGAMGTGKTKALAWHLRLRPQTRVLSVTYRRTLARETSENLEGFINYEDECRGWLRADKLAVQVDSLHRVIGKFDLLVLDEVTYTLSRLFCDVAKKDDCWKALKHFIKNTPKILLMDKNLDQTTVDLFEELESPCFVMRNEFKAHKNKKLLVAPNFLEFKEKLLGDLERNKKICFPCSSKKKLLLVCREAEQLGHRVLWYTGDGRSKDVWLDRWDEYDLVAYTPTISAGVSYEKKHFDKVYGYFSSHSCCAEEAEQMLFRVRDIKELEIVLAFDNRHANLPTTKKGVTESVETRDSSSFLLSGIKWDLSTGKIANKPRSRAHIGALVKRNISKNNISGTLLGLLDEQGANIEFLAPVLRGEELQALREDTKFLSKKIQTEEAVLTCQVPSVTREVFSSICSKKEKAKEDVASCRKFMLSYNFGVEQESLTPEFVLEYSGKEKIFENQSLAFSGSKAEQKERLADLLERKNEEKKELKASKRISLSCNLEKVVYGRRLFYWLGYGSTTSREKKSKEEMASRLEKIQQRAKKSRCFQELFGKVPEEKEHIVRYVNGILRKMFDCYISRTSRNQNFGWELMFCSPWSHNKVITPTPQKKKYQGTIPKTF